MRALQITHWLVGGAIAIFGALAFRLGPQFLTGYSLVSCQLTGLLGVALGFFIVMRGVNRAAQARPPLEGEQAVRRIPGLRRPRTRTE
ncbi:MAG TPA: hypothetical protein VKP30_26905 [Polyangiaceae bacterium]|nr:hypothetical protein [Polyangiaceae bacterium]